jgi:hypothetical protein
MVRRGPHYKIIKYFTVMILLVVGDGKITNNGNLINSFLFSLLPCLVYYVIESDCGTVRVGRHCVSIILQFFVCPLAKVPFTYLPNIRIRLNELVLLTAISKIKVSSNYAQIRIHITRFYLFKLLNSRNRWLWALKMNAVHSYFEQLIFILLSKLYNSDEIASLHLWVSKWLFVEVAWISRKNEGIVPVDFNIWHEIIDW